MGTQPRGRAWALVATFGVAALLWGRVSPSTPPRTRGERPGEPHVGLRVGAGGAGRGADWLAAPGSTLLDAGPARVFPPPQLGGAPRRAATPAAVALARIRAMRFVTARRATYVRRLLDDLGARGSAAVPDIGEFLRRGNDVDFTKLRGGALVGHRTLRLALLETLQAIGGSAAMGVALDELDRTREPLEIATVARALSHEEPAEQNERLLRAVDDALRAAADAPATATSDVGPLFDVLRDQGGEAAVDLLERSVPRWGEYALIALAGLPDGAGLPSLAAMASTPGAAVADHALPLRILAQSTAQYPEAGATLVELARAGRIPDDEWNAMSEALGGRELRFSDRMFAGTALGANGEAATEAPQRPSRSFYVEWMNVRYDEFAVVPQWSPEQRQQRLALIDDLLAAASSDAAVRALQRARGSLQL